VADGDEGPDDEAEAAAEQEPTRTATSDYRKAMDTHRSRLVRLSGDRGIGQLKSLYESAQDTLESKLRNLPGGRRTSMSATQHRMLLAQARQGEAVITKKMAGELGELSEQAQVESLRGLSAQMKKMEKHYTGAEVALPIDEAARFWGVIDKRRTSLLKQHDVSMARYGASTIKTIEQQLAVSLATGETLDDAAARVRDVADTEWWKAERIARTEQAWAFNATHSDGIEEVSEELGDIYQRWTEHVTDDLVPMDDRVGIDSIVMHGQVAKPGEMFVMPDDPRVSDSLIGEEWEFPPNRPNDRGVLTAWRPHWGGLAWVYVNGRKRFLSRP
jgi:hypothetical protein